MSLLQLYCRGADCWVLVYDVTNQKSFDKLKEYRDVFLKGRGTSNDQEFQFLLIDNKIDIPNHSVDKTKVEEFSKMNGGMIVCETSAKTGEGIEEAFESITRKIIEYKYKI